MRLKCQGSSSIYIIFPLVNNWFGHKRWSGDTWTVSVGPVSASSSWENQSLNFARVIYACTETFTAAQQQQSAISLDTVSFVSSYCIRSKRDCTSRFTPVAICSITTASCQSKSVQIQNGSKTYPFWICFRFGKAP